MFVGVTFEKVTPTPPSKLLGAFFIGANKDCGFAANEE